MRGAWRAFLLAAVLVASSCSGDDVPSRSDASQGSAAVDPQVLADVSVAVFRAPGPTVRPAMRVMNFVRDFMVKKCGGTPAPPERTSDRHEQDRFPDLQLIREKTLSEREPVPDQDLPPPDLDRPGCDGRSEGNVLDTMPTQQDWMGLGFAWEDVVATAMQDEQLVALKAPMAQCLRDGMPEVAGSITDTDPALSYLMALDLATAKGRLDTPQDLREQSVLYAECGADYFGRLQELLEAERPAMIERHREVLERFAGELVAAGYVP